MYRISIAELKRRRPDMGLENLDPRSHIGHSGGISKKAVAMHISSGMSVYGSFSNTRPLFDVGYGKLPAAHSSANTLKALREPWWNASSAMVKCAGSCGA